MTDFDQVPTFLIESCQWEEAEEGILHGTVGMEWNERGACLVVLCHLTAIRITGENEEYGSQEAGEHDERLDEFAAAFQPDKGWQTIPIPDHDGEWIVFMEPFSR